MKVLWLTSWYPSVLYPFDGDFIQRHARATALFCNIEVIHVVKDTDGTITDNVKEIVSIDRQLTERIIYYKPVKTSIQIVDRFLSGLKYKKIYRNAVRQYILQNGKPGFVNVHIAMKAGLTALWLKRKYDVPYILSEQWGGYLNAAKPNIKDYNFVYRIYWSKIIKNACASTFVSTVLKDYIGLHYKIKNSFVIPNVVNPDIFYPVEKAPSAKISFIHISTMGYQKNTEGILAAMKILSKDYSFELNLYGTANAALRSLVTDLELQNHIFFKGEATHEVLSKAIQQSDALILYSRYETFGCVLIEANACGVPVIVSNLDVFHEIVEEGVNGVFAEGENPEALAGKLKEFIAQKNSFDKKAIAATAAKKYNYKKIGQQFIYIYSNLNN